MSQLGSSACGGQEKGKRGPETLCSLWQKAGGGVAGGAEFSVPGSLVALRKPWQVEMGGNVGVSQVRALAARDSWITD